MREVLDRIPEACRSTVTSLRGAPMSRRSEFPMAEPVAEGPADRPRAERRIQARTVRGQVSLLLTRHYVFFLLLPAILVMTAVVVYPIGYAGWLSLHFKQLLGATSFAGLGNYARLLGDASFWSAMVHTVIYVVVAVCLEFLAGLGLALLTYRQHKGASLLRSVLLLPLLVSPIAAATMWRVLYNHDFGPIPYIVRQSGIPGATSAISLSNPATALFLIVIVSVWQIAPFVYLVLLAGMRAIPREQYEAVRIDGGSRRHEFWHVTLPWLRPVIVFLILFRLVEGFRVFELVWMLTGGGPGESTQVASLYIYLRAFQAGDIGYAGALSIVLLGIIFVFALIVARVIRGERFV